MPYVQARRHTLGRHPAQGPPQILASRRRAPYFLVERRCQRQQEHMGMLTMRYLLAYYSGTTSQWRSLDTDLLPQQINRAEELPAALENAPMIALSWMLERRPFGSYQATVDGKSDECVMVYEPEPTAASPLGNGTDYVGPGWKCSCRRTSRSEQSPSGQESRYRRRRLSAHSGNWRAPRCKPQMRHASRP